MSEIRQALSRDAVVAAALEIIDERGLDACTMRAVADAVGVEAMSLYWHVPSKEALLDGVVEMMLVEVEIGRADEEEWRARIAEFGRAFRRVLLRHPNALPLLAGRPFGAYTAAGRMTEDGIVSLRQAGFPSQAAIRALRIVSRFVVGFALIEISLSRELPPRPAGPSALADLLEAVATDDPDDLFDFGLETMIDGLEARLQRG